MPSISLLSLFLILIANALVRSCCRTPPSRLSASWLLSRLEPLDLLELIVIERVLDSGTGGLGLVVLGDLVLDLLVAEDVFHRRVREYEYVAVVISSEFFCFVCVGLSV